MPKPGIIGFIGAIPVIMPRLGSKSAGKKQKSGKEVVQEDVQEDLTYSSLMHGL